MSRWARSRTQPARPHGLRLSLHSPQPTRPSSVSTRTNVQGRQPPSQCSASTRAIFMTVLSRWGAWSTPGRKAASELIQREQPDAAAAARRGPRLRRVVAPRRQVERDVAKVRVRRDVQEGLQPVLDEPQNGPPPAGARVLRDERAQIVALVHASLLALDVGEPD